MAITQDVTPIKLCDIEPCGIAGRNYPFPIDETLKDTYTGIGGGLKYAFYKCAATDDGSCTSEDYLNISDKLDLTGSEQDNTNNQYLAFNTLYTYTVMDILHMDKILKPAKGHDSWIFGLASADVTLNGTIDEYGFLKYFEWSSSRLQLHVFPDTEDFNRFKNINDETIGNLTDSFKWEDVPPGNEEEGALVAFIKEKIDYLNGEFDTSIEAFRKLVTYANGVSDFTNLSDEALKYCSNIDEELTGEACIDAIKANGDVIKCGASNTISACNAAWTEQAALFASGGLRNHVRDSLRILTSVATDNGFDRYGILSGSEEAMYGFLAANVGVKDNSMLNNVFDFGGQSIQLTKVITKSDLPAYSNDRNMIINSDTIDYYALSVNNFGSAAAAEWIENYWNGRGMDNACLLTTNHPGVFDKQLCLQSLRLLLEPVSYPETRCAPGENEGDSSLSTLMGISFVSMMSYIFM